MTTHHLKTIAIAVAALGLSAAAAKADILHYEAQLRGANETPANATRAHGVVTAILDTDRRALEYTVTYKDLSSPVTVAEFKEPTSPPDDPDCDRAERPEGHHHPRRGDLDQGAGAGPQRWQMDLRHLHQRQPGWRDPREGGPGQLLAIGALRRLLWRPQGRRRCSLSLAIDGLRSARGLYNCLKDGRACRPRQASRKPP